MLTTLLPIILAVLPGLLVDPPKASASKEILLLAADAAYKEQAGKEETFEGWLEYNAGTGRLGLPGRNHLYRLLTIEGGKLTPHPIYLGEKTPLLALTVGKEVRLAGKLVGADVDGMKVEELWPARLLDVVGAEGRQLKVISRMERSIIDQDPTKVQPQAYVFRDAAALAKAQKLTASTNLTLEQMGNTIYATHAQFFNNRLKEVDWSKQMMLVVMAGARSRMPIEVYRLTLNEGQLEVYWRVKGAAAGNNPPVGRFGEGPGLLGAAETVIVPRFDGAIHVIQDGAANNATLLPAAGQDDTKPSK